MQTRIGSLVESLLNILVGFSIALASYMLIMPLYGIHTSFKTDLAITFWFTLVSVIRSYALRRMFNYFHQKNAK